MTIDPHLIPTSKLQGYLQGAIIPRPIAFASTIDREGNVNLSPFSFFNLFSANPPILVFSPSRRVRDNTTKHTYENVKQIPEVVIHLVTFEMVDQASLTSCDFPRHVNEFRKAGLTEIPSSRVRPPRVAESPVSMECKVIQVMELGDQGGAGALVICEVLLMHIKDEVLDESGRIDPFKLDAVARLGQDYYSRVNEGVFKVVKPSEKVGVGIDQLPLALRENGYLTKGELAQLATIEKLPSGPTMDRIDYPMVKSLLSAGLVAQAWELLIKKV